MANLSVTEEMLKNFIQLNEPEQQSILQLVKTFVSTRHSEEMPQSLEEYNAEITAALQRAKNGGVTSIENLREEMKIW